MKSHLVYTLISSIISWVERWIGAKPILKRNCRIRWKNGSHLSILSAHKLNTVMPTDAFWMKGTNLHISTPKGQSSASSCKNKTTVRNEMFKKIIPKAVIWTLVLIAFLFHHVKLSQEEPFRKGICKMCVLKIRQQFHCYSPAWTRLSTKA